jgi:cobalt-zinc-cadmium resistance protein CzcA
LQEIPVVVRLSGEGSLEQLRSLPLRTAGGSTVPLAQVADLSYSEIPSQIDHDHMVRQLVVTANIHGRRSQEVARDVEKAIQALHLPPGYTWSFSGKYKTEQAALRNLAFVLSLSICVVALILWLEFRSIGQVLLILLTIPLAGVGAILSLALTHQSLNVSSMIGAVLLVGIVVRNGIMLMDYINIERKTGKNLSESIQNACMKRVRPILMTAVVTMLGLLPLAVGWGTGAELQRPLAIAVCGGILTSTLLTLVMLPAVARLALRDGRGL